MQNTSIITSEPINLSDFVLFLSVMKNKTAYRNTLSIILDESDIQIREVKDLAWMSPLPRNIMKN